MWEYVLNQSGDHIPTSGWNTRRIPELPLADGTTSVWYRKTINLPSKWVRPGRGFFVELEKAGHYAAIYWNGVFIADHFGQFSPFEADVTSAVVGGQDNEIQIYVHKADTKYVRRGAVVDQSSCPDNNPDCMGNAYRSAALDVVQRNWVGLVGDITFSWRPSERISDIFVVSSVRNGTLKAELEVTGANSGVTQARATVLDGTKPVLKLPLHRVKSGKAVLKSSWTTPVLWGPPPYGQPRLYMLRTELLQDGKVIDVVYTRFGFREVWVKGKDVFLNGQRLWVVGDYFMKLTPTRYINDRRPQAFMLFIMGSSGFNTLQSHWDDPGRPWLELADEMGMLLVGSFFCDGTKIQSKVDKVGAWTNWMASTTQEWVRARRNHPSIMLWRPADVLPPGASEKMARLKIAAAVRTQDPSGRPIADGSDVDTWSQDLRNADDPHRCDNGSAMAAQLARETKPFLTKEIYGDFSLPCVSNFFNRFYRKAYDGEGAGLVIQQLPLFHTQDFTPQWFSISGLGNRADSSEALPNWMSRQWAPTAWSPQFAGLYQDYLQSTLPQSSPTAGEYPASGLPAGAETAFLVSSDRVANPIGVVVAQGGSGTAWFVVPQPGAYKLVYSDGGVDVVEDVTVSAPPPFN